MATRMMMAKLPPQPTTTTAPPPSTTLTTSESNTTTRKTRRTKRKDTKKTSNILYDALILLLLLVATMAATVFILNHSERQDKLQQDGYSSSDEEEEEEEEKKENNQEEQNDLIVQKGQEYYHQIKRYYMGKRDKIVKRINERKEEEIALQKEVDRKLVEMMKLEEKNDDEGMTKKLEVDDAAMFSSMLNQQEKEDFLSNSVICRTNSNGSDDDNDGDTRFVDGLSSAPSVAGVVQDVTVTVERNLDHSILDTTAEITDDEDEDTEEEESDQDNDNLAATDTSNDANADVTITGAAGTTPRHYSNIAGSSTTKGNDEGANHDDQGNKNEDRPDLDVTVDGSDNDEEYSQTSDGMTNFASSLKKNATAQAVAKGIPGDAANFNGITTRDSTTDQTGDERTNSTSLVRKTMLMNKVVAKMGPSSSSSSSSASSATPNEATTTTTDNVVEVGDTECEYDKEELELLGISVDWLSSGLITEMEELGYNPEDVCIYDLEDATRFDTIARHRSRHVISPIDRQIGSSYAHWLLKDDMKHHGNNGGTKNTGPAQYVLSYAWSYKYIDIVNSLQDFCLTNNLDPEHTYVWMDLLCMNQHRLAQQQDTTTMTTADSEGANNDENGTKQRYIQDIFTNQLSKIGNMIVILAEPWKNPLYLNRIWCVFEMYTALRRGCQVHVILPPGEKQMLTDQLLLQNSQDDDDYPSWESTGGDGGNSIQVLYDSINNLNVETAQASYETDRQIILSTMVESSTDGSKYSDVHGQVSQFLRTWIRDVINDIIQQRVHQLQNERLLDNDSDDVRNSHEAILASAVGLMDMVGSLLYRNAELDESKKMHNTSLTILLRLLNNGDVDTTMPRNTPDDQESHNSISRTDLGSGKNDLHQLLKALKFSESMWGTRHASVALLHNDIGNIFTRRGQYVEALYHFNNSLRINELIYGTDHPTTAVAWNSIGLVMTYQGHYDEALVNHYRALAVRETVLGKDNIETATSYNNMGLALHYQGELKEALQNYQQALAINERLSKKGHQERDAEGGDGGDGRHVFNLAGSYNNIGSVYKGLGDYENALKYLQMAMDIEIATLGTDHPSTATSYHNIGTVFHHMGNYDDALDMYQKSLTIREDIFGPDHPDTATSYFDIGHIYKDKGYTSKALSEFRKAIEIRRSTLGPTHPDTIYTNDMIDEVMEECY